MKSKASNRPLTKDDRIRFAKELIKNGGDGTRAYKTVKPEVNNNAARQGAYRLKRNKEVQAYLQQAAESLDLTPAYYLKTLKESIEAGVGRKATNRDTQQGLKQLADTMGWSSSLSRDNDSLDDDNALEGMTLKQLRRELNKTMKQIDNINANITIEDAQIVTNEEETQQHIDS